MAAERYKVMILRGAAYPEFVRNVGWFSTADAAEEWCEERGFGHAPVDGEWAVIPQRDEDVQPHVAEGGS